MVIRNNRSQIIKGHIYNQTYPNNLEEAQGLGQVVTGAGTTWITTDALVAKEYNHQATPATLTCPQIQILIVKSSTALIDDRILYTIAESRGKGKKQVEENFMTIQNALALTGGAINISKSS